MADRSQRKKYPIFIYLCYLVILAILLSGVSLARYTGATSGKVAANLSPFACSFDISNASSLTFSNSDYWLVAGDGATNTARTVRFDMRNYVADEETGAAERISDVPLQGTLRFSAPAEFAENLALQIIEVDTSTGAAGEYIAVTPQIVLGDLIRRNEQQDSFPDVVIDTAASIDYDDRTDGLAKKLDWEMSLSGGFTGTETDHSGTITAEQTDGEGNPVEDGALLTIAAEMRTARYSIGYTRQEALDGGNIGASREYASVLYVDCERTVPFYTVDIALPQMTFSAKNAEEKTFVLFVTTVSRADNADFSSVWNADGTTNGGDGASSEPVIGNADNWDDLLRTPTAGDPAYTLNGAKVTGYHFTQKLPVCSLVDGEIVVGGTTTVDIYKEYQFDEDGHATGGAVLRYAHVAPVSENTASVEHAIEEFYTAPDADSAEGSPDFSDVTGVNGWNEYTSSTSAGLYGLCVSGGSGFIDFTDLTDNPYYADYTNTRSNTQSGEWGGKEYELSNALSKGYATSLTVVFAQAAEEGGGA